MVSCNQAAKLVLDVLALPVPRTFLFWSMSLLRMALQEPLPNNLSTSFSVSGLDIKLSELFAILMCLVLSLASRQQLSRANQWFPLGPIPEEPIPGLSWSAREHV